MKNTLNSLGRALLKPVNKAAIIFLGFYTMLWGVWVANPFWSVFEQAQLFSALGLIAPEVFWGCFALFCGAITTRGALKRRYRPLLLGAGTAFVHWMMIAIFYFIGDWQNTGGITSLMFAVYAAFIYLNIKVNHRKGRKTVDDIY